RLRTIVTHPQLRQRLFLSYTRKYSPRLRQRLAPLHHWDGRGFEPAPASGSAPRRLDRLAEPPDPLVDPPGRHGRKRQPQRARAGAVHEERRARRERDAALDRRWQELRGVEPGRQREEERE